MMRSIDEPVDRAGLCSTNPRGRSSSGRRRVAIPREEHSKAQAARDLVLLVARSRASLSGPTAVRSALGSETPAVVYQRSVSDPICDGPGAAGRLLVAPSARESVDR
jgi:hypothetical protein